MLTYSNANEFDQARTISDELVRLTPQNYAALHLAGVVATAQKRLPEAAQLLKQALNLAPDTRNAAASQCGLRQALFTASDLRQAEDAFRRAHRMDPSVCGYAVELALTLAAQWKLDLAIDTLRLAIKRHPADASPCVALGTISHSGRTISGIRWGSFRSRPATQVRNQEPFWGPLFEELGLQPATNQYLLLTDNPYRPMPELR